MRVLERQAAIEGTDEAMLALKYARIRYGMETVPEHWSGLVLDPLHLVQMEKSVAKLNKMLRKKGCLPLQLIKDSKATYIERTRASDNATVRIKTRKVTLVGDMPGSEGRFLFAARLHHLPDATIIHRSRAGLNLPESVLEDARLAGPYCAHCEKRRKRSDTFIVVDTERGTTLQVGSTCLDKYTSQDCSAVLYAFNKLKCLTDELDSGTLDDAPSEEYGCSPLAFLAHYRRIAAVRSGMMRQQHAARAQQDALRYGLECREGEGNALAWNSLAWDTIDADIMAAMALLKRAEAEMLPGLERHRAAQKATDLGGTLDATKLLSERDHNVAAILESGTISAREAGTFAGIIGWNDEAGQRAERDRMRLLASDPQAQATEMAKLIAGASVEQGNIVLDPAILAKLLLEASQPALLSLATIITNPQALTAPAHDGEYLAAEGAQGTWELRLDAALPYRSGGGHTLKLTHRGADGKVRHATIFAGGRGSKKLSELGWAEGDTITVQATVKEHSEYRGEKQAVLDPA
jgi:hypothetical protein